MRILYVEDNPANVFLVQRVARMGNHEVIHYSEGQPALDHFEADKPDLVLMDVQLPGLLTGLDVVKALRAKGHQTPMVAVTAYAMSGDRERCLEAGCNGYLSKPLPVGELVELFKRYEAQLKPASRPDAKPEAQTIVSAAVSAMLSSVSTAPIVEAAPVPVATAPVAPVIEAPAPKPDFTGDATVPSRPTLEMQKAEAAPPDNPATSSTPADAPEPQANVAAEEKTETTDEHAEAKQPEPTTGHALTEPAFNSSASDENHAAEPLPIVHEAQSPVKVERAATGQSSP